MATFGDRSVNRFFNQQLLHLLEFLYVIPVQLARLDSVIALYRPDVGYHQSFSFLACILLLSCDCDETVAFKCLANLIVKQPLFAMVTGDLPTVAQAVPEFSCRSGLLKCITDAGNGMEDGV